MFDKKYKKYLIISFIVLFITLLIIALITWNIILSIKKFQLIIIFIFLTILLVISSIYIVFSILKITDEANIKALSEKIRKEEYQKIMNKLEEKKKKQESQEQKDYLKLYNNLISNKEYQNLEEFNEAIIKNISKNLNLGQALLYQLNNDVYKVVYKYAYTGEKEPEAFKEGETLPGEAARSKEVIFVRDIPENYFKIESGLGSALPRELVFMPVYYNDEKTFAIFELAFLNLLSEKEERALIELQKYICEQSKHYYE